MAVTKRETALEKAKKTDKHSNENKTDDPVLEEEQEIVIPSTGNITAQYEMKVSIGPYSHIDCKVEYIDSSLDYESADDIGRRSHSILRALQRAVISNLKGAGFDVAKFIKQNKDNK